MTHGMLFCRISLCSCHMTSRTGNNKENRWIEWLPLTESQEIIFTPKLFITTRVSFYHRYRRIWALDGSSVFLDAGINCMTYWWILKTFVLNSPNIFQNRSMHPNLVRRATMYWRTRRNNANLAWNERHILLLGWQLIKVIDQIQKWHILTALKWAWISCVCWWKTRITQQCGGPG